MTRAITGDRLVEALEQRTFIKGGAVGSVEGIKYDFRMGSRVLKASIGQPIAIDNIPEPQRVIEPGEIVFVLTEESLDLPHNIMAELSPKRKLSHDGILILGGFCVDPLYQGKLLVGLYNFFSTRWPLRPGKKLIAAVFYELAETEVPNRQSPNFRAPQGIDDFPDELVRLIQNYKPIALQGLQESIGDLQRQLADLRNEVTSGQDWRRQFQDSLNRHDQQIDKMLRGLADEQENRKDAEKAFKDQLSGIQRQMWKMAAVLTAIVAGIGIVISSLGQAYLPRIIDKIFK